MNWEQKLDARFWALLAGLLALLGVALEVEHYLITSITPVSGGHLSGGHMWRIEVGAGIVLAALGAAIAAWIYRRATTVGRVESWLTIAGAAVMFLSIMAEVAGRMAVAREVGPEETGLGRAVSVVSILLDSAAFLSFGAAWAMDASNRGRAPEETAR